MDGPMFCHVAYLHDARGRDSCVMGYTVGFVSKSPASGLRVTVKPSSSFSIAEMCHPFALGSCTEGRQTNSTLNVPSVCPRFRAKVFFPNVFCHRLSLATWKGPTLLAPCVWG
ncbi:unnamed protein product [Ectocarpus sp. 12 AP-2014]